MGTSVGYLLDTNVLVQLVRKNPLGRKVDAAYGLTASPGSNVISVVTVGEALSLAQYLDWKPDKCAALMSLLDDLVWIDINNQDVLDAYARIDSFSTKIGRSMGKNDAWIAATASVTGMTLLTTDKDFDHLHPSHLQRIWIDPAQAALP